ncbi:TonB-dependent receptor domain-containing protein [Marinoscillum pacificum]|uniref:TonB-dependent receptor domain-containing protein n=1 Tax=Marinoscillum pacificum TaxID=392723 RepID=UPI0021577C44|nr:outer membrane beta-barrel family protein [Marinoscillum pacificum]
MRLHLWGLLLLGLSTSALSQRVAIQGKLLDENNEGLVGATVTLQNQSDSVMVAFSVTDSEGNFSMEKAPKGDYVLVGSFIGYEPLTQQLSITDQTPEPYVLQPKKMSPKDQVLSEVVVGSERIPITLKQDTIEYDAQAFKTNPNASVEELLKRLPGMEVQRDGTIKAQGEKVQKVLVDGKEFFGNDPKMATKNLPADAIDKVQVFDKKSEFAEFAGIDDGNEQKTINLALKEDKKDGTFGKITGAYGTDNRFQAKANINRFNAQSQLSYIGNYNNINQPGFTIGDYLSFAGGGGFSSGGGSFSLEVPNGISVGNSGQDGVITSTATGINFNRDFGKKLELRSNYIFSSSVGDVQRQVNRTNFLEDGSQYSSKSTSNQDNRNFNHNLSTRLKYELDPSQDITLKTNIGIIDRRYLIENENSNYRGESIQNQTIGSSESTGDDYSINLTGSYRKKFKKAGRTISGSLETTFGNTNNRSDILAISDVFYPDSTIRTTLIQDQISDNNVLNYSGQLSYTEPLSTYNYLDFQVVRRNFNNGVISDYYDLINNERVYNAALSRSFTKDYVYEVYSAGYNFNKKKFSLAAGVKYQTSELTGEITPESVTVQQEFNRFLPNARAGYEFGNGKDIKFSYRTNLKEPSLQQLQPTVNNNDPLRIYQGNPNLNPEYAHEASLNFIWFDQFSFTNFFAFVQGVYTNNKIVTASSIDDNLVQYSQPINTDYDLLLTGSWNFGRPIKPLKIKYNIRHQITYNEGFVYLNNVENIANRWDHSMTFKVENRSKEHFDLVVGSKVQLNTTSYSESELYDQGFTNYDHFVDLSVNLGIKWIIKSSIDRLTYSSEDFSTQPNRTLWRAELSRFILKGDRGELKLVAFDLLNQNIGVDQSSAANYIQEERVNSLGRYFLMSFTYSLSAFKGGGIHFERGR